MNEVAARSLTAAIVKQAFDDLDDLYVRIMNVRSGCKRNKSVYKYMVGYQTRRLQKKKVFNLPFDKEDDLTILIFFKNNWGKKLLSASGIDELPEEIEEKLVVLESYLRYCKECIDSCKKDATKQAKAKVAQI